MGSAKARRGARIWGSGPTWAGKASMDSCPRLVRDEGECAFLRAIFLWGVAGMIDLGIMNLGRNIESFNFRNTGFPVAADTSTYINQAWIYPNDLYSPVAVVRNQSLAFGVSIQYPVLEYKHDVRVCLDSP